MKIKAIKKKKKGFDCVEMMHKGARRIQAIIENMTVEEEVEYWRKRSLEFEKKVAARRKSLVRQRSKG